MTDFEICICPTAKVPLPAGVTVTVISVAPLKAAKPNSLAPALPLTGWVRVVPSLAVTVMSTTWNSSGSMTMDHAVVEGGRVKVTLSPAVLK